MAQSKYLKQNGELIYPYTIMDNILDSQTGNPYSSILENKFDAILEHNGQKNLATAITTARTNAGVTFTPQANGEISVVGTATAETWSEWSMVVLSSGTYIISGSANNTAIELYSNDGNTLIASSVNGQDTTFTVNSTTSYHLYVEVPNGVTVNTVVYPMIRDARIDSNTFLPYSEILGQCIFAYVDNHGNQSITTSTGGETVMATRTIPYLAPGKYLLMGGGSLYCNQNTAYYKFAFYKNNTRFINNRIYVTNNTANTNIITGMAIRVVDEPATNVRIDYVLGAQSGAIGYSKGYNTRWGFIFKIADNSVDAHID